MDQTDLKVFILAKICGLIMICFLERAGLRSRQAGRIYQNRTGCNRLSLCIAWADGNSPLHGLHFEGMSASTQLSMHGVGAEMPYLPVLSN